MSYEEKRKISHAWDRQVVQQTRETISRSYQVLADSRRMVPLPATKAPGSATDIAPETLRDADSEAAE
jgi:hypothetical protein